MESVTDISVATAITRLASLGAEIVDRCTLGCEICGSAVNEGGPLPEESAAA